MNVWKWISSFFYVNFAFKGRHGTKVPGWTQRDLDPQASRTPCGGGFQSWLTLVSLVNCVRPQVEQQGTQLETLQQRNLLLQEENSVLKEKLHNLERYRQDHLKCFIL